MDRSTIVKVKLSYDRLYALQQQYYKELGTFDRKNADDHEQLLNEHAAEMHDLLLRLLHKGQNNYTLELRGTQALAFMQYWLMTPIPSHSLQLVAIQHIIQQIDKKAKNHARTTMPQVHAR
jgi:hypothetical protein